jgi:hypothetical protein
MGALGRRCLKCQHSTRTGENPPYGMTGGIVETSASFEVRYAPRSYPTAGGSSDGRPCRDKWLAPRATFRSGLRWRPKLLQWEFLVGIGPNNQVGNVSFATRPPMWHPAGDDNHITLGEPS